LRRQEGDVSMEAIQTDAGMTGTAQSLFGKASGQAGKGGGMFAALLALVGRHVGNAKELDQTADGASNAAAGLQGLLALFNPAMVNPTADAATTGETTDDQTLIGDSGSDPLAALTSANGLDLSQLSDRNKLALLAQALADAKNGDTPTLPAGDDTTGAGFLLDPAAISGQAAADRIATPQAATAQASLDQIGLDQAGLDERATDQTAKNQTAANQAATGQTVTPADLDAILAELRARAAAKFGADNGKPAVTNDAVTAAATANSGTDPKPLTPGLEIALPSKAAPFGLDGSRGDRAAPAVDNSNVSPSSAATPAQPAVAAGSLVSLETQDDSGTSADDGSTSVEATATPASHDETAAPLPPDGEAPPSKTPDVGTSPFQKVEVAPPANAKPDPRAPIHPAPAADADKKTEPKPEPAAASTANDGQADKTASDDRNATASASDTADSAGNSSSAAGAASIDSRGHAAARTTIQVPVEKLSQFLTQDDQLPLQIQRAVANGRDHITIQIVPHDLGRIEIKLDFDGSGTINTVIAADRPQTLDLLKRDAGGLERALQDAGFKTDGSSLSFNLQSDQRQQYQNQQNNPGPAAWQSSAAEEAERSYRPTYRIASTADAIRAVADGRVNIAV
jgi:flagellar hook-length control protein FliK